MISSSYDAQLRRPRRAGAVSPASSSSTCSDSNSSSNSISSSTSMAQITKPPALLRRQLRRSARQTRGSALSGGGGGDLMPDKPATTALTRSKRLKCLDGDIQIGSSISTSSTTITTTPPAPAPPLAVDRRRPASRACADRAPPIEESTCCCDLGRGESRLAPTPISQSLGQSHDPLERATNDDNQEDIAQHLACHHIVQPLKAPMRALRFRNSEIQTLGQKLNERNGRAGICDKHMPWFGIDVGGSLVKVVFFDPKEAAGAELTTLKRIRQYLRSAKPYGSTGRRDAHLEMPNCLINRRAGSLHFIRFATSEMPEFLAMAKNKRFAETLNRTICATGGGACKFEDDIRQNLGIKIHKSDELDSIIYGIHYIDKYNSDRECYFLKNPLDDERCVKVPYDFSRPYPYLVVNIGSGVSILAVYSSTSYSRISGSSIGGGTFLGLCCLLTQCETFDEAIRLARAGSSNKIDKLVKDIYGGDYAKFNLTGDTVASSFGHMNMVAKRKNVSRADLARALLEMVTINIGSIARMCAVNEGIDRVVFIGNFLRVNQLSMRLLSYAVNYWSKGAIKALFLEHEGYFGAVGCFVESTQGCQNC